MCSCQALLVRVQGGSRLQTAEAIPIPPNNTQQLQRTGCGGHVACPYHASLPHATHGVSEAAAMHSGVRFSPAVAHLQLQVPSPTKRARPQMQQRLGAWSVIVTRVPRGHKPQMKQQPEGLWSVIDSGQNSATAARGSVSECPQQRLGDFITQVQQRLEGWSAPCVEQRDAPS